MQQPTVEHFRDFLAVLLAAEIIDEGQYWRAADLVERLTIDGAPIGGPSEVVDRRIGRMKRI